MARLTRRNFSASAMEGDLLLLSKFTLHTKFYMHSWRTCRKKSTKNHNTTQNTTKRPHTSKSAEHCPKHAAMIKMSNGDWSLPTRSQDLVIPAPRRKGGDGEGDATRLSAFRSVQGSLKRTNDTMRTAKNNEKKIHSVIRRKTTGQAIKPVKSALNVKKEKRPGISQEPQILREKHCVMTFAGRCKN